MEHRLMTSDDHDEQAARLQRAAHLKPNIVTAKDAIVESVSSLNLPPSSLLRTDVPAYPGPPDRAEWEREHGAKPFPIVFDSDFSTTEGLRRFGRFGIQAKAVIARDYTTLDREDAITEQTKLEHICERVKVTANIPELDHVFFDSQDGKFWVYPVEQTRRPAPLDPSRQYRLDILDATEQRLNAIANSACPYELRLDLNLLTNVRVAGYTHLPLEEQLVRWAKARGWKAAVSRTDNTLCITKPKRETLGEALGKELPHSSPDSP